MHLVQLCFQRPFLQFCAHLVQLCFKPSICKYSSSKPSDASDASYVFNGEHDAFNEEHDVFKEEHYRLHENTCCSLLNASVHIRILVFNGRTLYVHSENMLYMIVFNEEHYR